MNTILQNTWCDIDGAWPCYLKQHNLVLLMVSSLYFSSDIVPFSAELFVCLSLVLLSMDLQWPQQIAYLVITPLLSCLVFDDVYFSPHCDAWYFNLSRNALYPFIVDGYWFKSKSIIWMHEYVHLSSDICKTSTAWSCMLLTETIRTQEIWPVGGRSY